MNNVAEHTNSILRCIGLQKTYAGLEVPVLAGIDFSVSAGEQVVVVGASGSGKSTLLHLLAGLDSPSQGEVMLMGKSLKSMTETNKGLMRNQSLGFVYQFHHLLPEFTALENVALPLLICNSARREAYQQASEMLTKVGLGHRLEHLPGELSGGERQRAAVARALVTKPKCVIADEPTGNLDRTTAHQVFDMLLDINQTQGVALVVVTHDLELAAKMNRQYRLVDGLLQPL